MGRGGGNGGHPGSEREKRGGGGSGKEKPSGSGEGRRLPPLHSPNFFRNFGKEVLPTEKGGEGPSRIEEWSIGHLLMRFRPNPSPCLSPSGHNKCRGRVPGGEDMRLACSRLKGEPDILPRKWCIHLLVEKRTSNGGIETSNSYFSACSLRSVSRLAKPMVSNSAPGVTPSNLPNGAPIFREPIFPLLGFCFNIRPLESIRKHKSGTPKKGHTPGILQPATSSFACFN